VAFLLEGMEQFDLALIVVGEMSNLIGLPEITTKVNLLEASKDAATFTKL